MSDKDKVLNYYKGIKNSLDDAFAFVKNINIDDDDERKMLEKLSEDLYKANQEFKNDIEKLEKESEWDKLCIAFFGETNAGKSTLIDALRILYKEQTRMLELKKNTTEYKDALTSNIENINIVSRNLNDYSKTINDYAKAFTEHESQYQAYIRNLQNEMKQFTFNFEKKEKKYQDTIANLQKAIGVNINESVEQKKVLNEIIQEFQSENKKLRVLAVVGCILCCVAGFLLANYF